MGFQEALSAVLTSDSAHAGLARGDDSIRSEFDLSEVEYASIRSLPPTMVEFMRADVREKRWALLDSLPLTQHLMGELDDGALRRSYLLTTKPRVSVGAIGWLVREPEHLVRWLESNPAAPAALVDLARHETAALSIAEDHESGRWARQWSLSRDVMSPAGLTPGVRLHLSPAARCDRYRHDVLAENIASAPVALPPPRSTNVLLMKRWPEYRPVAYRMSESMVALIDACNGYLTIAEVAAMVSASTCAPPDRVAAAAQTLVGTGVLWSARAPTPSREAT